MSTVEPHAHLEELLAQADWVRALARALVGDPERADEVAQESWLEVLRRPPRQAQNLRAWLGRVVRSKAYKEQRSAARRAAHEERAARPEATPAVDELVSQVEEETRLAQRVLALEEPYRSVLLLRYFRSRTPQAIARELERPLNTVRSQLRRGLERLRAELDRESGGRDAWMAALAPLLAAEGLVPTTTLGIERLVMGTNAKIALVGLGALVLAAVGWRQASQTAEPDGGLERASVHRNDREEPPERSEGGAAPARQRVAVEAPAVASLPEGSAPRRVRGRVVDLHSRPLSGVGLHRRDREADASGGGELISAPDGSFVLEVGGPGPPIMGTTDPGRLVVASGWVDQELWVVVAPARALDGVVEDPEAVPIGGARARVVVNAMALRDFDRTPEWIEGYRWVEALSDAQGRFHFPRVPVVGDRREADSFVSKEGYVTSSPPFAHTEEPFVRVILEREGLAPGPALSGVVWDPGGKPVEGAEVHYGLASTRTDGRGRFDLPLEAIFPEMALVATHADHLPASISAEELALDDEGSGAEGLVLVLRSGPARLRGLLLHPSGQPALGFQVTLAEGTMLGTSGRWAELAPSLGESAGAGVDERGAFELVGLEPRPTTLVAVHLESGTTHLSEPFVPGAGDEPVVWVLPPGPGRLRARAVARGEPLAGLRVRVRFQELLHRYGAWREVPVSVLTDAHGHFEVEAFDPRCRLRFEGLHAVGADVVVPPHAEGERVDVEVPLLSRFRVELRPDDPAEEFAILDAEGRELRLSEFHSYGSIVRSRVRSSDDGFPVCVLTGEAATIVFYAGGEELRRIPLVLPPGGVHLLRY